MDLEGPAEPGRERWRGAEGGGAPSPLSATVAAACCVCVRTPRYEGDGIDLEVVAGVGASLGGGGGGASLGGGGGGAMKKSAPSKNIIFDDATGGGAEDATLRDHAAKVGNAPDSVVLLGSFAERLEAAAKSAPLTLAVFEAVAADCFKGGGGAAATASADQRLPLLRALFAACVDRAPLLLSLTHTLTLNLPPDKCNRGANYWADG